MLLCQAAYHLAPITAPFGVCQPNFGQQPITQFGPTILAVQYQLRSTSLWLTKSQALSYNPSDLQLMNNTASVDLPLQPQLSGAGEILTWEINATLPSGISFGANNGTFWGTPTELWPTTAYKVWANNTGGSAEGYLNITVVDQVPVLNLFTNCA